MVRNWTRLTGSISTWQEPSAAAARPAGRAGPAAGTAAGPAHPDGGIHPDRRGVRPPGGGGRAGGDGPASVRREAALAGAANGTTISGQDPLELMLIELMRAAGLVRRIATNLNQAVAKLTATGQPTGDLPATQPRASAAPTTSTPSPTRYAKPCGDGHGDGGGDRVIGKISTPRGEHVQPLLYYLFGPGRREEHTDPHLVAGWRHPADLEPPLRADGKRDFTKLAACCSSRRPRSASVPTRGRCGTARCARHPKTGC